MAGKTPGTPRKTSSKKSTKQTKTVTPIQQGAVSTAEKTVTSIDQANGRPATEKYDAIHPGIYEEIRRRAYELYEERGRLDGFHHEDWSRAETEVLSRFEREKSA